jgi:type I restriction enzyme M protein
LWFFDRGKNKSHREHVLMVDARNVYRKVNRTINDFSPEQMANLSSIVWLYRGQKERFVALVQQYLHSIRREVESVDPLASELDTTLDSVRDKIDAFVAQLAKAKNVSAVVRNPILTAASELADADGAYRTDQKALMKDLIKQLKDVAAEPPATTKPQLKAVEKFAPLAERVRGLVKQIDLLCKLAGRVNPLVASMLSEASDEAKEELTYDRRAVGRELKKLDEIRVRLIAQLRRGVYFHRQASWLLERFPDGKLVDVPGLVKLVSQAEIEAADWSLTPGRYVGVAPAEVDEDFDFEQTMHDIHVELADLNEEAVELAAKIQANYQEMVV